MNVSDKEIGEWQERMMEQVENMTEEEKANAYVDELMTEHVEEGLHEPELFNAFGFFHERIRKLERENEELGAALHNARKEVQILKNRLETGS